MKRILLIRRVMGSSMEPTFKAGQIIVATGLVKIREQDVVILRHGGLEKVKRLHKLVDGKVHIVGDNLDHSTDSRQFGWLPRSSVIAKVIWPR